MTARKSDKDETPVVATGASRFEAAQAHKAKLDEARRANAQSREAEAAKAHLAAMGGPLHEVLVELANGHRTVHRFRAQSVEAARSAVEAELAPGSVILEAGPAGQGIGSNDITPEQQMAALKRPE